MSALSPQARALLETIAGPESAGRYDVIYGGSRASSLADHPRQYVPIMSGPNKGKKSSAAGKYQFLERTWNDIAGRHGLTDFSPENQDRAAWILASETYAKKTGRDLQGDLAAGRTTDVPTALRSTWTSLPGGIEQGITSNGFTQAYMKALVGDATASVPRPGFSAALGAAAPSAPAGRPAPPPMLQAAPQGVAAGSAAPLTDLASLFMTDFQNRAQQRAAEEQATQERRRALLLG